MGLGLQEVGRCRSSTSLSLLHLVPHESPSPKHTSLIRQRPVPLPLECSMLFLDLPFSVWGHSELPAICQADGVCRASPAPGGAPGQTAPPPPRSSLTPEPPPRNAQQAGGGRRGAGPPFSTERSPGPVRVENAHTAPLGIQASFPSGSPTPSLPNWEQEMLFQGIRLVTGRLQRCPLTRQLSSPNSGPAGSHPRGGRGAAHSFICRFQSWEHCLERPTPTQRCPLPGQRPRDRPGAPGGLRRLSVRSVPDPLMDPLPTLPHQPLLWVLRSHFGTWSSLNLSILF